MEKFSDSDRDLLLSSPHIEKVTDSQVVFTVKFKTLALERYLKGANPSEVFKEFGINTALFLPDFPRKTISRWKEIYFNEGVEGFEKENRGKGATGRPKRQQFKSIEEEVIYLREENAFLKKLQALAEEYQRKNGSR